MNYLIHQKINKDVIMNNIKHEKEYIIRSYEGDTNGDLRIITLFNIFQDMADEHAEKLGLGLTFCLNSGFAWVGSKYHIRINRLPKIHEKIKVITWPSEERKIGAIRDFKVLDETGNIIIAASSMWILINFEKKRPISLKDNLPNYTVFPEKAMETEFAKIKEVENEAYSTSFSIRYDDIDINNHVNNAVYPLWASEAVDKNFRKQHTIKEIEIEFKKEALLGEDVEVKTAFESNCSIHSIKSKTDNRELSRIMINWAER